MAEAEIYDRGDIDVLAGRGSGGDDSVHSYSDHKNHCLMKLRKSIVMCMKIICPVCQSDGKKLKPFAERNNEKIDLIECKNCHQQFLHPYPSDAWLSEEYSNYFNKRQAGLKYAKAEYFENLFRKLNLKIDQADILEFGPGEGDSVIALKRLGEPNKITLVERNDEANDLLKEKDCVHYNLFLEEYLSQNPDEAKFDYIFLFDVLEHLKDPLNVLKTLKETKLKKDGSIITTFPVSDSFSRKLLGPVWPQYKVEHLNYFTNDSVEILASKSGLKISKNEVLFKTLSLEYLLNVGKGFGPASFKKLSNLTQGVLPKTIKKWKLSLGYGEKLVIFRNGSVSH